MDMVVGTTIVMCDNGDIIYRYWKYQFIYSEYRDIYF